MMNLTDSRKHRAVLGLAAGVFGTVAALTTLTTVGSEPDGPSNLDLAGSNQEISGNCDEAEHANDPECAGVAVPGGDATSTTVDDDGTSTTVTTATTVVAERATPASGVHTVSAGDAGSLIVAIDSGRLQVVSTSPNSGWRVEVEQAVGREIEVTFTSGARRIDVNLEFEDGQVRERVRERLDDIDDDGDDDDDDNSGPGSVDDSSGPGSGDDGGDGDSSGPGSGDDGDDDDSSGPGSGDDD